jgi:tRNA U38,U39,U40 pseudouridine synthase TruA
MEELRQSVNKELPDDVRIFCFLPVSNRFNAKNCTSHREYSYFLPTFMLQPIQQIYLASPPSKDEEATDAKVDAEESKEPVQVVT